MRPSLPCLLLALSLPLCAAEKPTVYRARDFPRLHRTREGGGVSQQAKTYLYGAVVDLLADWDGFWGDGKTRCGFNIHGMLHMEIRDKLR